MRYVPSTHECQLICSFDEASSPRAARWNAVIAMIYATGAGISELATLSVDNVNMNDRLVTVAFHGRRRRVVPVHSYAAYLLNSYLTLYPRVPRTGLFDSNGYRLRRIGLQRELVSRSHQLGLSGVVTSHGLRLACIRDLLASGMPAEAVAQLLGAKQLDYMVTSVRGL
jgi:site-specific recombinase XerD